MRIRTVFGVLVGVLSVLALARPAAAQGAKIDFSGGYQYLRFLEYSGSGVPAGWGMSLGTGKDWIKFVADAGGHYTDYDQLHTFQGGVELSGKGKRVVPFARVLSGLALWTGYGEMEPYWVFTPEGGVKIMASDRIGLQASVGFPIINGEAGFRFFTGIVIRK